MRIPSHPPCSARIFSRPCAPACVETRGDTDTPAPAHTPARVLQPALSDSR